MDNYIKKFFENKKYLVITYILIISFLALFIRLKMFNFISWDYKYCIEDWIDKIIKYGGIKSLKYSIGNYNIIYMTFLSIISYLPFRHLYVVKLFSVVFDYVCAIYGALIINKLLDNKKNKGLYVSLAYTLILFIPTSLLNSALWGQCDSIYTAFTLISLYYLINDKILPSFIFAGIAFAFKLQFVFAIPIYIYAYFKKNNISLLHFITIPVVNVITCFPAIIMGRSIKDCLLIYFSQTGAQNDVLTNNFPNIYKFIEIFFGNSQGTVCLILAVVIIGSIILFLMYNNIKMTKDNIINLSILFIIIMTQFLPYMHERYAFTAEILLCIYVVFNNGKWWSYLMITEFAIGSEYLSFLSSFNQDYIYLISFIYVIYSIYFCIDILSNSISKKELELV